MNRYACVALALAGICLAVSGCADPAPATGLTIVELKEGTGPAAKNGDKVVVHYTGWLKSGSKFDSSVDRGTPFDFRLGQGKVIKGWDQGVPGMKVGGKRKLIIPSELAYGVGGSGSIPPNSDLTFDIELLKIESAVPARAEEATTPKSAKPKEVAAVDLKSEDLKVGTGPEAKSGDKVLVHYTGWLKNGTKFDSSLDRDTPFSFRIGQGNVIKGWDQGVPGMKVGGKRKLTIPSELAYGVRGRPPIPPNAELTFEIELLKIE